MKRIFLLFVAAVLTVTVSLSVSSCAQKNSGESFENEENDEYDGPDKAAELAYRKTMNPATGRVDRQKLWEAILQTQQMKDMYQNTPSTVTGLTWIERGSNSDATGPSNGNPRPGNGVTSGRIRAIWVDLADATGKTVWTAGVDGGLWKTSDITAATPTWTLINDYLSIWQLLEFVRTPPIPIRCTSVPANLFLMPMLFLEMEYLKVPTMVLPGLNCQAPLH